HPHEQMELASASMLSALFPVVPSPQSLRQTHMRPPLYGSYPSLATSVMPRLLIQPGLMLRTLGRGHSHGGGNLHCANLRHMAFFRLADMADGSFKASPTQSAMVLSSGAASETINTQDNELRPPG